MIRVKSGFGKTWDEHWNGHLFDRGHLIMCVLAVPGSASLKENVDAVALFDNVALDRPAQGKDG